QGHRYRLESRRARIHGGIGGAGALGHHGLVRTARSARHERPHRRHARGASGGHSGKQRPAARDAGASGGGDRRGRGGMKSVLKNREIWLALAIVAVVILVTLRFPRFSQPGNLLTILNDTSILMMLALGQMVVILTRSIDLSMASNLALTGMIVAMVNAAFPMIPIPLLIAGCVLVGAALGVFIGILVWKLAIPPIVVTVGTLAIFRGLVFVISGGAWVNAAQMSPDFIALQRGSFVGLPVLTWFAIVVAALFYVLMTRTPAGRSFYAIGVNPTASVYTGINVGRTKFLAFVISGAISGLCGYL